MQSVAPAEAAAAVTGSNVTGEELRRSACSHTCTQSHRQSPRNTTDQTSASKKR